MAVEAARGCNSPQLCITSAQAMGWNQRMMVGGDGVVSHLEHIHSTRGNECHLRCLVIARQQPGQKNHYARGAVRHVGDATSAVQRWDAHVGAVVLVATRRRKGCDDTQSIDEQANLTRGEPQTW